MTSISIRTPTPVSFYREVDTMTHSPTHHIEELNELLKPRINKTLESLVRELVSEAAKTESGQALNFDANTALSFIETACILRQEGWQQDVFATLVDS